MVMGNVGNVGNVPDSADLQSVPTKYFKKNPNRKKLGFSFIKKPYFYLTFLHKKHLFFRNARAKQAWQ